MDGSGAIDFEEFYGLWFSLTRPNEVTLQEVKAILQRRCRHLAGPIVCRRMHACMHAGMPKLPCYLFRVVDRTGAQLQRLSKFLQTKQPFFQQLQPEVVGDVSPYAVLHGRAQATFLLTELLLAAGR